MDVLGDQTDWEKAFVYDAFLNVMDAGRPLTGREILQESRMLGQKAKADYEARFGGPPAGMNHTDDPALKAFRRAVGTD